MKISKMENREICKYRIHGDILPQKELLRGNPEKHIPSKSKMTLADIVLGKKQTMFHVWGKKKKDAEVRKEVKVLEKSPIWPGFTTGRRCQCYYYKCNCFNLILPEIFLME